MHIIKKSCITKGSELIYLRKSLAALHNEDFNHIFKKELCALGLNQLPLQQALQYSSYALDSNISAMILKQSEAEHFIEIKAGVFYTGMIAGCNCADDPSPADEQNEFCELNVRLNKKTAEAIIELL